LDIVTVSVFIITSISLIKLHSNKIL
jgi:hypothetical protein